MGHENRVVSGLICEKDLSKIREAVCIQVEKVFDSCREKDCIENAKVIFKDTCGIKWIINNAINVKIRKAEVKDVFADIEPVPFKRGFYTVDVKFFITVTLDFFVQKPNGGVEIKERTGLITFDKKVILFGSEGNVKIFKAKLVEDEMSMQLKSHLEQDNKPIAKVEVADPIGLSAKIEDLRDKLFDDCCCDTDDMPRSVAEALDVDRHGHDEDEDDEIPRRRVVATVGLFSIIKIVRFVQLLIPAFDYCVPNKECIAATEEHPCELFETIEFPFEEFFPAQIFDFPGAEEAEEAMHEMAEHDHDKHHH